MRQLLVDVSELVKQDLKTGIQRVVRAILYHWLLNPPKGWAVEPVYAKLDRSGYLYARRFTCVFLEMAETWTSDEAVDAWPGDIFVGLDLQAEIVPRQREFLADWFRSGVNVKFVVYDLLPVLKPDYFPAGAAANHAKWLETITTFSGAVCISRAIARELGEWLQTHAAPRSIPFEIDWFHLGADIETSRPTSGLPDGAAGMLLSLREKMTFLMVGTIEPRKGHSQVLAAFEMLWEQGATANLVIVGKQGWHVEELIERVSHHKELGARLFWADRVTDEYLEKSMRPAIV